MLCISGDLGGDTYFNQGETLWMRRALEMEQDVALERRDLKLPFSDSKKNKNHSHGTQHSFMQSSHRIDIAGWHSEWVTVQSGSGALFWWLHDDGDGPGQLVSSGKGRRDSLFS